MASVSIREAKNRLTELARRVEQGERITVTRNGKPVMELVRASRGGIDFSAGDAWLKEKGLQRPKVEIAADFDDPLPEDFLINPLPERGPA